MSGVYFMECRLILYKTMKVLQIALLLFLYLLRRDVFCTLCLPYIEENRNFCFYGCHTDPVGFYFSFLFNYETIPVAVLSKGRVCGRSIAVTAGSNLARGMSVCLL